MRRPILLALLAVLALPGAAQAAPVKLSPRASAVSAAGVATIEAANPNRHALRGTATVTVAGRTIARRAVRLARRSVGTVALRFDARALAALRAAGGRATIRLAVRRSGGRTTTARRTLTLRLPSAAQGGAPAGPTAPPPQAPAPAPAGGGTPGAGTGTPPAASVPTRWTGRMGAEGPYDDLELTLVAGQLQITKPPTVPVMCFENGGAYRSALSFDLFDASGPWTVGTDGDVAKEGLAVNQLVGGSTRSITYKVTGTTADATRVAGTLGMSYFDSKYDFIANTISFVNCSGSESFEAVPAA